jgi:hypothetical protein
MTAEKGDIFLMRESTGIRSKAIFVWVVTDVLVGGDELDDCQIREDKFLDADGGFDEKSVQ